ncbi:nucleotide-sugar epimerase [Histomonas meleagridis]|uniref:nucleotide-sugar epimerase n=1 Tax=Histomonas meleagridis TaxID=135588 RepID=UPI003559840D|nr:nucleotide-sugar epimerase [Histomonas meleagridis]KAH0798518.1 nucleotide-sugar epimerase [Histomonas meleagridis]
MANWPSAPNLCVIFLYVVLCLLVTLNVQALTRIEGVPPITPNSFPIKENYKVINNTRFNEAPAKNPERFSLINGKKLLLTPDKCINRTKYKLNFLIPFGLDPLTHKDTDEYVLVLGTGGLVGSELREALLRRGYKVLHVLSRHHLDLRTPHCLDIFNAVKIKFAYFLSYEVGGSKFLHIPEYQNVIRESNIQLQNNVFNWLVENKIRYVFPATSLAKEKNFTYGYVKNLGENFTKSIPEIGRVVRFWNVYGFEYVGSKSHVVPDLLVQCLTKGRAKLLTTGKETLQFAHTIDTVEALILILENFERSPLVTDITDGVWTPLLDVIKAIEKLIPTCEIQTSSKSAKPRFHIPPNFDTYFHKNLWHTKLSIEEGINATLKKTLQHIERSKRSPTLSIIIDCGDEINDNVIKLLNNQVRKLQELVNEFMIFTIEIIATTKSISSDITLPIRCTVIVNKEDNYIDEAIAYSHSNAIMVIDYYTLPSYGQFDFFHRELTSDYMIYYAEGSYVNSLDETSLRTKSNHIADYKEVNGCGGKFIKTGIPLLAASRKTWQTVGFPPRNTDINRWMLQLEHGFTAIKFEEPAWCARNNELQSKLEMENDEKLENVCCDGLVERNNQKSNSFIYLNQTLRR